MSDESQNNATRAQLEEDKKARQLYELLMDILDDVHDQFLTHGYNISGDALQITKALLRKQGFPIRIDAEFGTFEGYFHATMLVIIAYADISVRIAKAQGKEFTGDLSKRFTKKDEDFARATTALFLMLFIPRLKSELRGIISESYALAFAEIRKLFLHSPKGHAELIEQITKGTERRRKKEGNVRRGNPSGNTGFWNTTRKVDFYDAVEAVPKISIRENCVTTEISFWEHAFRIIGQRGEYADEALRGESAYNEIPKALLREALGKWQAYETNSRNVPNSDCWKMFQFRHALLKLGYQVNNKFSTLDKYYRQGREQRSHLEK